MKRPGHFSDACGAPLGTSQWRQHPAAGPPETRVKSIRGRDMARFAHGREDSERAQLAEGTAANSVWGVARTGRCREWDIAGAPPQPRRGGRPRGQRRRPVGMAVRRHCGGGWAAPRGGVAPLADQLLRWRGRSPHGAGNPLVDKVIYREIPNRNVGTAVGRLKRDARRNRVRERDVHSDAAE